MSSQSLIQFLSRPEVWTTASALVGFLTLTWLIRGAPIGQAMREESAESPSSSYRDRVVVVAVVGFLLVAAGTVLASIRGIPWSIPAFALGFGTLVGVLKTNRQFRHVSPSIRRVHEFAATTLRGSLIAGILVIGNVVAFKYGGRAIDLTRDQAYSLSSGTIAQLQRLDQPISFTVYFGNSERSLRQSDRVRQMLELYKRANPNRVSVDYLDPNLDFKEFETLVKRVPQIENSQGGGIVLRYGEGETAPLTLISLYELFAPTGNSVERSPDRFVTSFVGEDAVTSALARLREGERSKIAFTTGHGEPPAGELDPSRPGLGLWRARLSVVGIDVVETNLLADDVPDAVNLLVICAPRRPFQPDELERLKAFVMRDGQLIVLLGNTDPTGLEDFLRTYNVEVGSGLVIDPRYNVRGRPFSIVAPVPPGSNQPIVESLIGRAVFMPDSAPLTVLGGPQRRGTTPSVKSSNPGVVAQPFLRTSPDSWLESTPTARPIAFEPGKDTPGPVNVGVAVVIPPARPTDPPRPRMVVFSSPMAADNSVVAQVPTNLDLMMNAVSWLRGRPSSLGIPAKTHESLIFVADPSLRGRLVMVPTILAILVILGLGVTVYVARRD